ncbi:MAG: DUF805 domain-containing protein [Bacteroidales bacterium]
MKWFLKCMKNYANFNGRARRKEYWMFILVYAILTILLLSLDEMLFGSIELATPISSLFALALLIPSLSVGVRRLHDIDKTGWWYLLYLIPIIGWIWLIILHIIDGTKGANKYGDDPKTIEE